MSDEPFFPQRATPSSPERISAEQRRAVNDVAAAGKSQFTFRMACERLHRIASELIAHDMFKPTPHEAESKCRAYGEEIGAIVNKLNSAWIEDRPKSVAESLASWRAWANSTGDDVSPEAGKHDIGRRFS